MYYMYQTSIVTHNHRNCLMSFILWSRVYICDMYQFSCCCLLDVFFMNAPFYVLITLCTLSPSSSNVISSIITLFTLLIPLLLGYTSFIYLMNTDLLILYRSVYSYASLGYLGYYGYYGLLLDVDGDNQLIGLMLDDTSSCSTITSLLMLFVQLGIVLFCICYYLCYYTACSYTITFYASFCYAVFAIF